MKDTKDADSYAAMPDGQYLARFTEVGIGKTQYGDEMWPITLTVASGECDGRKAFDRIIFSEKAMPRAKMLAKRVMDLDVEADEVDMERDSLLGRYALITVEKNSYKGRESSTVTFAGYDAAPEAMVAKASKPDLVPIEGDEFGGDDDDAGDGGDDDMPF